MCWPFQVVFGPLGRVVSDHKLRVGDHVAAQPFGGGALAREQATAHVAREREVMDLACCHFLPLLVDGQCLKARPLLGQSARLLEPLHPARESFALRLNPRREGRAHLGVHKLVDRRGCGELRVAIQRVGAAE